jgi:E3 ubiquitin-protein ligase TRIP12
LGEEYALNLADLAYVDADVFRSLCKLQDVVRRKETIERDSSLRSSEKSQMIELLDLDGCRIVDLGLSYQLPGYDNIELRKGGSDVTVSIHNLDQYIKVSLLI